MNGDVAVNETELTSGNVSREWSFLASNDNCTAYFLHYETDKSTIKETTVEH